MTREEITQLESLFKKWMDEYDINKPNFLQRNTTAKLIKIEMQKAGRWRLFSRGNHQIPERTANWLSERRNKRKLARLPEEPPF